MNLVTGTLHKLSAGDGYTYLTRQVAAGDSTERGYRSLGDYYSARGEAPGRWQGAGLAGLDISGSVTEKQMKNLFGMGIHPDADRLRSAAAAQSLGQQAAESLTRLGQKYPEFQPNQPWREQISAAYAAYNTVCGNAVNKPIPPAERERIRTDLGQTMFVGRYNREPRTEHEFTAFMAETTRPESTAVAGYDITFSPVKSVSTLWAVAPKPVSEQIETAHAAAVSSTIAWLEANATYTRIGAAGIAQIDTRGLIAATFTHRDSRAGDPDLHTHVAISNKVQSAVDGRWLALDGQVLHRMMVAASEHYNSTLETEIERRIGGRFVERDATAGKRPIRELVGVDAALNDVFSARRHDILSHQAGLVATFRFAHGRLPSAVEMISLAQQANLATRAAKHEPRSLDEQRAVWHAQALQVLGADAALAAMVRYATGRGTQVVETPGVELLQHLAEASITAISARRATWSRNHVLAEVTRQLRYAGLTSRPDLTVHVTDLALDSAISVPVGADVEPVSVPVPASLTRRDGTSIFRKHAAQQYTSITILEQERRIVAAADIRGARNLATQDVDLALLEWSANHDGRTLNTSQAALVHQVTTSDRHLQLALAPAGTGKTTTMGALAAVWRAGGGDVVALAPQASAAQELAAHIPSVISDTLDKLAHDLTNPNPGSHRWARDITATTLLLIDEAGLASTPNLDLAISYARDRGARVLLIGDDRQRAAVGAGGVLRDIESTHGSLALDEVMRFHDPRQADASLALRSGDVGAVGYYLDTQRIHISTPDAVLDELFTAWQADTNNGIDSIMIAPTLEHVSSLNLRSRTARLAATQDPPGAELTLPNGEIVSAGDTVVTKKNNRRLSLGGTDFVRNNYRWIVNAIHPDGSITATETSRHLTRTLPAEYLTSGHVRLGYAATAASVQGLTVTGNAYALVARDSTRNDLYPALTRAKGDNHAFIVTTGTGDTHEVVTPDAITPPTAVELLSAIVARDGSDHSATTTIRETHDPYRQLGHAARAYEHALLASAEYLLGPDKLADLTTAAEHAVPGITTFSAWDTLRGHLAVLQLHGHYPVDRLNAAAESRELTSALDLAAVFDWRLDRTGNHSLGVGPLPWLPELPAGTSTPLPAAWHDYLQARRDLVVSHSRHIRVTTADWTIDTAPVWAAPYLEDRGLLTDLALWRSAHDTPETDLRPAGDIPQRIAHRILHRKLSDRAVAAAGTVNDTADRWTGILTSSGAPATITADPYWPVLVHRLAIADTAGLPVTTLLRKSLARELPTPAPAAALWSRLAPHIGNPATTVTSHILQPTWSRHLAEILGDFACQRITHDRLWPTIVVRIDGAARAGTDPEQLLDSAARLLAPILDSIPRHHHSVVLLANIATLTDPTPPDLDILTTPDPLDLETRPDHDFPDTTPAPGEFLLETGFDAAPAHTAPPADHHEHPPATDNTTPPIPASRLYAAVRDAYDFYRARTSGSWVPGYLTQRALPDLTTIAGYAPAGWTTLTHHLRDLGYSDTELLAAGLTRTSSRGTLIDAFRDRLVLPIHNLDGHVVAFTGRAHPATTDARTPKYINTPTTSIYNKTATLYGFTLAAKEVLKNGGDLVIAEGPLDAEAVIAATDGTVAALALLGTALTSEQLDTVDRISPLGDYRVVVATDSDAAGRKAATRGYRVLTGRGVADPLTLPLGSHKDPAEALQYGGSAAITTSLTNAAEHPLSDVVIDEILSHWRDVHTPEHRVGGLLAVAPIVASLPPQRRARAIQRVSVALALDVLTVADQVVGHLPPAVLEIRDPLLLPVRPSASPSVTTSLQRIRSALGPSTAFMHTPGPAEEVGVIRHGDADVSPDGLGPEVDQD